MLVYNILVNLNFKKIGFTIDRFIDQLNIDKFAISKV